MISVKDKLPRPNTKCKVQVSPYLKPRREVFKFVTYSDEGHFWDNGIDEILQDTEVTHWEAA